MTRKLEQEMEEIQKGTQTKAAVLRDTVETLKLVTAGFREKEAAIGAQLIVAVQKARLEERTVGNCPKCGGQLVILRSKKSGKRFVGCSNYFQGKCNTAYPLPQKGTIKALGTVCKSCGSPVVATYFTGRRPLRLCLNLQCTAKGKKE
jgi:DNA topoisomerase-1